MRYSIVFIAEIMVMSEAFACCAFRGFGMPLFYIS